jgi:hypothetical protein
LQRQRTGWKAEYHDGKRIEAASNAEIQLKEEQIIGKNRFLCNFAPS